MVPVRLSLRMPIAYADNSLKQNSFYGVAYEKKQVMGLRFRRQHPIGKYILDFYYHQFQLGIEVDGEYHNEPKQMEADQLRTRILQKAGVYVLRFSNAQVEQDIETVMSEIRQHLIGQ